MILASCAVPCKFQARMTSCAVPMPMDRFLWWSRWHWNRGQSIQRTEGIYFRRRSV
jgi:hypothetical protein